MNDTIIITGPEQVAAAQALALRKMLHLELKGMTRRGRSAYAIIKDRYGLRGSKQKVYDAFTKKLQDDGILVQGS